MSKVKVLIKEEELKEKDDILKIIEDFKKGEKDKLKGFLYGLAFSTSN